MTPAVAISTVYLDLKLTFVPQGYRASVFQLLAILFTM